jgi:hypothetical protein
MCPGSDAVVAYPRNLDCCTESAFDNKAKNPFNLAGRTGNQVLLIEDCSYTLEEDNNGSDSEEENAGLIVVQVEHVSRKVPNNFQKADCCLPVYDEYGYPTGDTTPAANCDITYSYRYYSIMTCEDYDSYDLVARFYPQNVVYDVHFDGYNMYECYKPVFVVASCTPAKKKIIEGTSCDTGSGSGSGSQPPPGSCPASPSVG